jgi:membrane protein
MRRLLADARRTAPARRARQVVDEFSRHNLLTYASAMSFQILLALIPFVCFLLALIGFLNLDSIWRDHAAPTVAKHVSTAAYVVIDDTVRNVLGAKRGFWLTAGLVITLWEISGAVRTVMGALDSIYRTRKRRSLQERLVTSLVLSVAVALCVLGALAVVRLGPAVFGSDPGAVVGLVSLVVRWGAAVALLALAVGLLVRYAPVVRRPVRWVSLGTGLVVGTWALGSAGYGLYVTKVADYGSVFGGLSAAFVLMTFLYLSSIAFLAGVLVDELVRQEVENG